MTIIENSFTYVLPGEENPVLDSLLDELKTNFEVSKNHDNNSGPVNRYRLKSDADFKARQAVRTAVKRYQLGKMTESFDEYQLEYYILAQYLLEISR